MHSTSCSSALSRVGAYPILSYTLMEKTNWLSQSEQMQGVREVMEHGRAQRILDKTLQKISKGSHSLLDRMLFFE